MGVSETKKESCVLVLVTGAGTVARVSLKRQSIFLRPGHLTPTVLMHEESKTPISRLTQSAIFLYPFFAKSAHIWVQKMALWVPKVKF